MKLANTHYSYCSNIHGGEQWGDHFEELKKALPAIKQSVVGDGSFGLGLRLSAAAAVSLRNPEELAALKDWLDTNNLYVFTMNGFPYGDFHLKRVKDQVHAPDWTSIDRLNYTLNLFEILSELLPSGEEGGISTSPLSYRFWYEEGTDSWEEMRSVCTLNLLRVADFLYRKEVTTGKYMHLDIEPEPDGVLENSGEFFSWYLEELIPKGIAYFKKQHGLDEQQAAGIIKRYICLCYDVCHFALEYEDHACVMDQLADLGIKIGKFQISAALKVKLGDDLTKRKEIAKSLAEFDEPIYLHQVIGLKKDGGLQKYRDLGEALLEIDDLEQEEWRSHFHVPIFLANYAQISSTQSDILEVLDLHKLQARSKHVEVETYTWGVLPIGMQLPIAESIAREMNWMLDYIKNKA